MGKIGSMFLEIGLIREIGTETTAAHDDRSEFFKSFSIFFVNDSNTISIGVLDQLTNFGFVDLTGSVGFTLANAFVFLH